MTVNTTESRVAYDGDGLSQSFAVPFYFLQDDDLLVYLGGVVQTLTTHYTVSGAGNPGGGSIAFNTAPAAGTGNVVVIREPDLLQGTKYPANDPFPARTHETALDKLTMLVQRTRDLIGRSFRLGDADTSGASVAVPTPQGAFLLGWNPAGTALQNYAASETGALPVPVPVAYGGTGAINAATARGNLGLGSAAVQPASAFQPYNVNLVDKTVANAYTKPQVADTTALTHNTAWDATLIQHATVNVNGGAFTIANPGAQTAKCLYMVYVSYTTAHAIAWGSGYKGVSGITPTATAGARDCFTFRSDGSAMELVGYNLNIGA